MKNRAFTLIELLVVIAIIGLLASIVVVNVNSARDKARIAKAQQFSQSLYHALGSEAVGVWTFDEGSGSTIRDSSGFGNDGGWRGTGAHWSAADKMFGANAGRFNGVDDYIDIPDLDALDITKEVTVEAWFKTRRDFGATDWYIILIKESYTGGNYYANYILRNDPRDLPEEGGPGLIFDARFSDGNFHGVGQVIPTTNQWHHVAGVFDTSSRGLELWLDGNLVRKRTDVVGLTLDTNTSLTRIGAYSGSEPPSSFFDGLIDEVRIYATALSSAEIQKHYAEGLGKHQLVNK